MARPARGAASRGADGPALAARAPARGKLKGRPTIRATILVPSYNHAAFVLDAVRSALGQSEPGVEVVVIDDGSTDESPRLLAGLHGPRLTVHVQENAGLSTTLNRGLALARGRWVKFLPSDDLLHPDCIARQLAAAAAAPTARIVFALPEVVDAACAPLADPGPQAWFDGAPGDHAALLRGLLERNFLCAPSALFDRDLARSVGGFDPSLRIAQDYDLWLKMLAHAPAVVLRERLVRVRWHGANQSAVVTPRSEAERAQVVRGALERMGIARWTELFRDGAPPSPAADARARAALAGTLERSGLHELAPLVAELRGTGGGETSTTRVVGAARAPETPPAVPRDGTPPAGRRGRVRPGIGALLRRVVGSVGGAGRAQPQPAPAPTLGGARPEHWVVVAHAGDVALRAARLAAALARGGVAVSLATPPGEEAPDVVEGRVRRIPGSLPALRELLRDPDQRLRVVVQRPDAATIAFAREAHLRGARVLYDRAEGRAPLARADVDSERALVATADDLIGTTRAVVKQLAASRRMVHLLPDPEDEAGAVERARSLCTLAARPTLTVAVLCGPADDAPGVAACLAGLAAARAAGPFRIAVVDDGVSADVLDDLIARDEADEIALLRNALRGRASGCNLALRAAPSELVALVDASWRVPSSWLDGVVEPLVERRALGALVACPGDGRGTGWAWLAPRLLLTALGGFDEAYDPGSYEDADLAQQLASRGYEIAAWTQLATAGARAGASADAPPADARAAARHFRRKWRREPRAPALVALPGKV